MTKQEKELLDFLVEQIELASQCPDRESLIECIKSDLLPHLELKGERPR